MLDRHTNGKFHSGNSRKIGIRSIKAPSTIEELNELASRPSDEVLSVLESVDSDIVVLGAGGKMGFHLSLMIHRGLAKVGSEFKIRAISRFKTAGSTASFEASSIETIALDLTDNASIDSLPDSRNVFYLAGVKFGASGNLDLLNQMNVAVPRNVARRYALSDARVVAISTGCVYRFTSPQSGGSVESDPLDPPGEYALSCIGREQAFRQSGLRSALIRLNYSVDLRYGVLVDIAMNVLNEHPIDLSTGFVNTIWQGDANAYVIQALGHASNPPFVINVTGEQILKVRSVAERFGQLLNRPVEFNGTEKESAWLNNASLSHKLWGPPRVDEDRLIVWVADWIMGGGEVLNKPTQFQNRDGTY